MDFASHQESHHITTSSLSSWLHSFWMFRFGCWDQKPTILQRTIGNHTKHRTKSKLHTFFFCRSALRFLQVLSVHILCNQQTLTHSNTEAGESEFEYPAHKWHLPFTHYIYISFGQQEKYVLTQSDHEAHAAAWLQYCLIRY